MQRGHNRGPCFFDEQDYHAYLSWLGEALLRERCVLHAYVLMTNHVHLLITPERTTLARVSYRSIVIEPGPFQSSPRSANSSFRPGLGFGRDN